MEFRPSPSSSALSGDAAVSEDPGDPVSSVDPVDPVPSVDPGEADGAGSRTITIGLGTGLFVPLAILFALGGFTLGRRWAAPPPAAPASVSAVVSAQPTAATTVIQLGGAAPQFTQPQRSPEGELAAGSVLNIGEAGHPLLGASPPEITGRLLDGTPVKLSDYLGQPLAVNFWASWCPPCRIEMPWLEESYLKHKDEGFVIIGVNAGERTSPDQVFDLVRRFVDRAGMSFPVLMPDDAYGAQDLYQVYGLPSTYLVNKEGKVVDVVRGMFPNRATLEARLEAILGPAETAAP